MNDLQRQLESLLPETAIGEWKHPASQVPAPLAAPATLEQWSACVALAVRAKAKLLVLGGATKLAWHGVPAVVDLVLSTRAWSGVIAYEPEDGTLTARTGSTMELLARSVAQGGHGLCPDVPRRAVATLGGVLGAGQSGFDRLRHGSVREQLLGTRVLLADGRLAKSGGRLVKNVTGYDMHRLWCGSHGSLCVILEASLRLAPAPRAWCVLQAEHETLAAALEALRPLEHRSLRPLAVCVHGDGERWTSFVALGGRPETVAFEAQEAERILEAAGPIRCEGARAREAWAETRELTPGEQPHLLLSAPRQSLEPLLAALAREGAAARWILHPWLGTACWTPHPAPSSAEAVQLLARLRSGLSTRARLSWRALPIREAGAADLDGSAAALPVMRRLKQAFDPHGLFARGVRA